MHPHNWRRVFCLAQLGTGRAVYPSVCLSVCDKSTVWRQDVGSRLLTIGTQGLCSFLKPITGESFKRDWGGKKRRKARFLVSNLGNDRRQAHSYNGKLIGNRIRSSDWYHFRWPWMTVTHHPFPWYMIPCRLWSSFQSLMCGIEWRYIHTISGKKTAAGMHISATHRSCIKLQGEWPLDCISL